LTAWPRRRRHSSRWQATTIEIAEGAFVMIHNAFMLAMGDASGNAQICGHARYRHQTLVDTYVARTKDDRKAIMKMMDDETWMTGAEAVKNGFADKMVANMKVAALRQSS
jgi:ATP-dependent Clp protease protease subunit